MRLRTGSERPKEPVLCGSKLVLSSPEPVLSSPKPVLSSPEPVLSSPEPVLSSPEPVLSSPESVLRAQNQFCAPRTGFEQSRTGSGLLRTGSPCNFFAFAPFSILIEDPEGNMVRSVELHSFYIVYASVKERKRGRLFSRDPANARDVGGFTLVAPPESWVQLPSEAAE